MRWQHDADHGRVWTSTDLPASGKSGGVRGFTLKVKRPNLYLVKSRLSSKGQVTVPVAVRDQLGLTPGTAVEFVVREGEAVLRKRAAADPVERVYGRLKLQRDVDGLVDEMRGPRPEPVRPKRSRRKRR
jgi:antitoxin PrlF